MERTIIYGPTHIAAMFKDCVHMCFFHHRHDYQNPEIKIVEDNVNESRCCVCYYAKTMPQRDITKVSRKWRRCLAHQPGNKASS